MFDTVMDPVVPQDSHAARIDSIVDEFIERHHAGSSVAAEDLVDAHPEFSEELAARLAAAEDLLALSDPSILPTRAASDTNGAPALGVPAIPGYRITRELHRGGQGVVYQAIQESTRREVAIKVLHGGAFAGTRDRARFEREVLLLSRLSHSNIVTVHDSGSSAGGSYFVMDYIRGRPLDEWIAETVARDRWIESQRAKRPASRDHRARIETILRLFEKICDAVNVAHLRGVIHRDLKPSNIRVDPAGEPHVLDFGLAKVGEFDELADSRPEMRTLQGQFVGSISWASPEQAEGRSDEIDVRTDVYSIGVMLFHALTGQFPYDVTGPLGDVLNRIRYAAPARPGAIAPEIDHEIDALVLKCLAKEPARRYQSAGDLGRDLQRYLHGEAIEAKGDSNWYVLRKSLRRYRVPVAVSAAFVLVLTAGFVLSLTYWRRASRARDEIDVERAKAVEQAKIAEAVNEFLNVDLLSAADPDLSSNHKMTVREALDAASARIEGRFEEEPLVEAAIRSTLGHAYLNLGEIDAAAPHLTRAYEIRKKVLGDDDPMTLRAANNLGSLERDQGRLGEAESMFESVIRNRRRVLGENHPETLTAINNLAELYADLGRYDEAEGLHKDVHRRREKVLGPDHDDTVTSLNNLAVVYMKQHRHPDAEPLLRLVVDIRRKVLGETHLRTLGSLYNLAGCTSNLGRYDEAEQQYKEGLALCEAHLGPDHPLSLRYHHSLGGVYAETEQFELAEQHLKRAADGRKRVLGDEHPDTLYSRGQLALVYHRQGRIEEAAAVLADAYEKANRALGDSHPVTVGLMNSLGVAYKSLGRFAEAEPLYRKALEIRQKRFGKEHVSILVPMANLGSLYLDLQRYDDAERLLGAATELAKRLLYEGHWHTGYFQVKHGNALIYLERYQEAEEALLAGRAILVSAFGENDERVIGADELLAILYERWNRPDEAERWRSKLQATTQPAS